MNNPNEQKMKKLRQDIGYQRKLIGLPDEVYREILWEKYKVESSTKLSFQQARELLNTLRDKAKEMGVFSPKKQYSFQKYKYDNLGDREGFASPKQLRKIEAIWKDVSYQKTDTAREDALNSFLDSHFGVSNIKWIEQDMVSKIIRTLERMKEQKKVNS